MGIHTVDLSIITNHYISYHYHVNGSEIKIKMQFRKWTLDTENKTDCAVHADKVEKSRLEVKEFMSSPKKQAWCLHLLPEVKFLI